MTESERNRERALRALSRHVELESAFGVRELPADPSSLAGLAPAPDVVAGEAAVTGAPPDAAEPRASDPAPAVAETEAALAVMQREVAACTRCEIAATRKCTVFGEGHPRARLMFIGEAPGADEDRTGRPFVGKAGQLLTRIIQAIHLDRSEVFIANVLKCRPPANRTPRPDEIDNCFPYLAAQIATIRPEVICTLGAPATRALLRTDVGIRKIRGQVHHYEGIPVVPTYHPAYLLRNPAEKIPVWHDIQLVEKMLSHVEG